MLGMKYPKYLFLTYGSYEFQWWTKHDYSNYCSDDAVAQVLMFSIAVLHYHEQLIEDELYDLSYDATVALAYALQNSITDGLFDTYGWTASGSGAISLECDKLSNYRSFGLNPMLIRKHLLATNFTGLSVSTN